MFKRFYEDELASLREQGAEFARAYPEIARELGLGGHDPDVERLLQGVAFLTGRIRQSLDSQFPELLHPLLGHLWPQALRPTPCVTVIEFLPRPGMLRAPTVLPAGALVQSVPVDGTPCQFRTAYETAILPLQVETVQLVAVGPGTQRLALALRTLPGAGPLNLGPHPLRLHIHGASLKGMGREAWGLYARLCRHLRGIRVRALEADGGRTVGELSLPRASLRPVGWAPEQSLLPHPQTAFQAARHLIEYFVFPAKYLFYDLCGLASLTTTPTTDRLEIDFELSAHDGDPITLTAEHVRTNCVPVVNLFPHTAMPLRVDGSRADYPLRPEGSAPDHYEIFSIEHVAGHGRRASASVEYLPFYSFARPASAAGEQTVLYQTLLRPPVGATRETTADMPAYPSASTYLAFVDAEGRPVAGGPLVSVDLLCTNRDLPLRLRPGEVCRPTRDIPSTLLFRDLGAMSAAAPTLIEDDGRWRFFAHLVSGLHAFRDRNALRTLLQLYHPVARFSQAAQQKLAALLAAISHVAAEPDLRTVGRPPAVMRGTRVSLAVHEDRFAHRGELILFANALEHFLADAAAVNSYTQLTVQGVDHDIELTWPAHIGTQGLL